MFYIWISPRNFSKQNSINSVQECFCMFGDNNFLGQTVSFGICQGVVFSHDKIHCLDPSKQPRALANLWTLALLTSQIQNAKLRLCLCSAFVFFNLASLGEKLGQNASVVFQAPDNYILSREKTTPWQIPNETIGPRKLLPPNVTKCTILKTTILKWEFSKQ